MQINCDSYSSRAGLILTRHESTIEKQGDLQSGMVTRGVYCLANDVVYDFFIGLCESLRKVSPDIPFELIPFDNQVDRVLRLQERYNFTVAPISSLDYWDQIGEIHYKDNHVARHTYRKFHIFEGQFDKFLFLDADMVLHRSVEHFFDAAEPWDFDVCYYESNWNLIYGQWELYEYMRDILNSSLINTGWLLSRRGVLKRMDVEFIADLAKRVLSHFSPTAEQPFLNFCLDVSRCRVISIHKMMDGLSPTLIVDDKGADYYQGNRPVTHWAGMRLSPSTPELSRYLEARFSHACIARNLFLAKLNINSKLQAIKKSLRIWKRIARSATYTPTTARPPLIADLTLREINQAYSEKYNALRDA